MAILKTSVRFLWITRYIYKYIEHYRVLLVTFCFNSPLQLALEICKIKMHVFGYRIHGHWRAFPNSTLSTILMATTRVHVLQLWGFQLWSVRKRMCLSTVHTRWADCRISSRSCLSSSSWSAYFFFIFFSLPLCPLLLLWLCWGRNVSAGVSPCCKVLIFNTNITWPSGYMLLLSFN